VESWFLYRVSESVYVVPLGGVSGAQVPIL
jgi:hypothetical protein